MFLFRGYFLGSRRTLENLFVPFERTLNGVVFDEKISACNHCAFAGELYGPANDPGPQMIPVPQMIPKLDRK